MMQTDPLLLVYLVPLLLIWVIYLARRSRTENRSMALLAESAEAGLSEPASLHPVIDPAKCLGCAACVSACPEGQILGLVSGKAVLVEPAECIGHGACRAACPRDAITLVFGTENRGVEIPHVRPNFETNVPGLFIAGELGGMGLIRNAIEQGRQAIEAIKRLDGLGRENVLDVVIVGAGPAGISASLAAIENKLRFVTLEQDSFGGTVSHFPRGKVVMTQPATLPIVGKVTFREISKEKLLEFWQEVAARTGLTINAGERVDKIVPAGGGFEIETARGVYRARSVLLAIGRRGTPRRLGVPGEDQSKVVYRLTGPEQYRGRHVLVVGGGDSALETAASVAEETATTVTLSYRSEAFSRAKTKNRERVAAAVKAGSLTVMLKSTVKQIGASDIEIEWQGRRTRLPNDAVIVCAGGILPTGFLKDIGVEVETKHGTA
jgi:thioredoxin reductase (NADPH)